MRNLLAAELDVWFAYDPFRSPQAISTRIGQLFEPAAVAAALAMKDEVVIKTSLEDCPLGFTTGGARTSLPDSDWCLSSLCEHPRPVLVPFARPRGMSFTQHAHDRPSCCADPVLDNAAKIMRLLHIAELRDLQTKVNELIVGVQLITADPKTDSRLGKVGK